MMRTPNTSHSLKWSWLRHAVQIAALLLFAAPLLVAGWGLFGVSVGGDDPVPAPADLPFFGSLSSLFTLTKDRRSNGKSNFVVPHHKCSITQSDFYFRQLHTR